MNPASQPADNPRVMRIPANLQGRDFCVGDIHGMFVLLDQLLDKVTFNPDRDRLFSVGDMVDRGPDPLRSLEFLAQPWFYAILGNHEAMLLQCAENPDDRSTASIWRNNGGDWWRETGESERQRMYSAIKPLPLAMELGSSAGSIGIVHADIPPGVSWQTFVQQIENGEDHAVETALWSRHRARLHKIAGNVPGIDRIYCGHNIFDVPTKAGNVRYIDTGAYLPGGQLTVVEISHPEEPGVSVANPA